MDMERGSIRDPTRGDLWYGRGLGYGRQGRRDVRPAKGYCYLSPKG